MSSYVQAQALLNKGVSRPTLYSVRLPQPYSDINNYLNFFCVSTRIPEVRTQTIIALGHEHMGIEREQPVGIQFGKPFTITVIENRDFLVYNEIRKWFNKLAFNINQPQNNRSIRMDYYSEYVLDMELVKLEQGKSPEEVSGDTDEKIYTTPLKIKFLNAYPVSVGAIALASSDYDQFTSFSVDFSYESYSVESDSATANTFERSDTQLLNQIGSVFNVFA